MTEAPTAPTAPSGDGLWAPARRRLTVGLVMTITLVAFESLAIATVMPKVEDDLGDLHLYGWVFSGFFLASLAGTVLTGILADTRGPALPFGVGLVLFAAGLLVGGLAPSMVVLIGARLAQGFGAGAIPAAAYVAVARGYPVALRPRVFAVFSTAWVVPGLVGPSLAAVIERHSSWHWVFLGLIPLVVVAGVIAVPPLAHHGRATAVEPTSGRRRRMALTALLVIGVGLVLAAGTSDSGPAAAVVLVVVGVPAGVYAFVHLVPAGTVRLAPGLPAIVAVRGILTWTFFGVDAYVALAVTEARGGSTDVAAATLSATAVLWTVGSWTQERVVARLGPRVMDGLAFLMIGVAAAAMVLVATSLSAWWGVVAWSIGGFGMGLGYAPLSVSALGSAEPGREGQASADLQLCDLLGVSLGTGLGGAVIALGDSRGWSEVDSTAVVFALGVVAAALGLAASRRLPVRLPGVG
ncbi:MAG: MFS transporter [Acidimicrobiales bacterium]|nr:MFS transporter [Acidimicrobiales bacterium]